MYGIIGIRNTISAPRRRAFFYLRPPLFRPSLDRLVVTLDRLACRPLAGPAELFAKNPPDMSSVIADTGDRLDHLCHPGQCPQIGAIAVRLRALLERGLDLGELAGGQLRSPTCPTRRPQRLGSASSPYRVPIRHRLMRDADVSADVGLADGAGGEHLGCSHPSFLHRLEVPTGTNWFRAGEAMLARTRGSGHEAFSHAPTR